MQLVRTPLIIQNLFSKLVWKIETKKKEVFLTFDDSPTCDFTYWILNLLSKFKIKATFFCIGESSQRFPEIIESILKEGHQIGNHSYSHKNGWITKSKKYISDINKCKDILPNTNLFRPPYGKIYPWQIKKLKDYKIIMWDVLSYDFNTKITASNLKKNVLDNVQNGSIIVFHDNKRSEKILKENLEKILKALIKKGYSFSTI